MREIKFRAWCEDHYVYSDGEQDDYFFEFTDGILKAYWISSEGNSGSIDEPPGPTSVELEPVEQFTGLKDKNGQEIYEGDILHIWSDFYEKNMSCVEVYWNAVTAKFDIFDIKASDGHYHNWLPNCHMQGWFHEVIGNIHDNPELFEESV